MMMCALLQWISIRDYNIRAYEMIKWVNTGIYVSKNTQRQKTLFGDLPTIEKVVRRYCKDGNFI